MHLQWSWQFYSLFNLIFFLNLFLDLICFLLSYHQCNVYLKLYNSVLNCNFLIDAYRKSLLLNILKTFLISDKKFPLQQRLCIIVLCVQILFLHQNYSRNTWEVMLWELVHCVGSPIDFGKICCNIGEVTMKLVQFVRSPLEI